MADPQVTTPQVNPAGGASSSWGPEEIALNPNDDKMTQLMSGLNQGGVVVTDGQTKGFIHHSKLNQFLSDNPTYEKGMVFSGPDGNLAGVVKASQAGQFRSENPGYQPGLPKQTAGWNPEATSRFASVKNYSDSIANDPNLQQPTTIGGYAKQLTGLGPVLAGLQIPRDAASEVGKYIRAEGESPRAPDVVKNVTSPAGEWGAQIAGSQFEPSNLATLGAFAGLPRSTAALRTLHRAIGGYYGLQGARGSAQKVSAMEDAARSGDIPETVRQGLGAASDAIMAVYGGRDAVENPSGAVSDLKQTAAPVTNTVRGWIDPLSNMSPADLVQRGAKPRNSIPNVEQKVTEALPQARRAADQLGIDLDSPDYSNAHDEGLAATRKAKQNVWDTLEQNHLGPAAAFTRDTSPVADSIDAVADGMSGIAKRRDPALVDSIRSAAKDYRNQNMSVSDMEQRIQELNNDLYGAQSKLKVQQDTLRNDPAYAYKFAELEGLRSQLNQALDQATGPGAAELKRTYGSLKTLEDILERSRNVANRPSPVGIFKGIGRTAGAGNIVGGGLKLLKLNPEEGLPQLGQGIAQAWAGQKAQQMNDRNFLVREAFKRTQPAGAPPGPQPVTPPPTPPGGGAPPTPPAGAAPITPVVPPVGPFAPGAQSNLPFGVPFGRAPIPSVAGETPAPAPPESGLTTGALPERNQPIVPSFANAGQPKPPTPEKVAPAAQETPQEAPQRSPQQQTAVDQAVAHARNGVTDKATHEPLREQAYEPGKESPEWQGTSQAENREGAAGLTSKEVHADASGQYSPEERERIERQKEQILGKDKGPDKNPVVIFQGGGAASGKTEAIGKELAKKYPGIAVSDPDIIKFGEKGKGHGGADVEGIPGAEMLKDSDPLGAAARLHDESSDIAGEIQKEALRRGQSIIIDGVGGSVEKMKQKMQEFKDAGYHVEVHYADKDLDQALKSMAGRFEKTGRWVPTDIMVDGHKKAARAYHQIYPEAAESSLTMADRKGADVIGGTTYKVAMKDGKVYDDVLYKKHRVKGGYDDGRDGLQGRQLDGEGSAGTPPSGGGVQAPLPGTSQATAGAESARETGAPAAEQQSSQGQQVVPSFLRPPKAAAPAAETPAPVSTARQNRQLAPGEPVPFVEGNHTTILMPDGSRIPAQYGWVESSHTKPSHNPMTFAKNPEFPEAEGSQERAYHSSKEAQMRVTNQSSPEGFEPGYIFNTNPDLVNGPQAMFPDGKIPAGNSRDMTVSRLYAQGNGDLYRKPAIKNAPMFGGDPNEVAKLNEPKLVRRLQAPASTEELRAMMTAMNKPMTGALGASERAVSAGKALQPESLAHIGTMVDQEDGSLRAAMQKNGPAMLKILQSDGVITDRERPGMIDSKTGGLNEDGKNFVEKALIGSVVDDPDLMDRTPKNVLNKLGSALGDLAGLAGRNDEYNISSLLRSALREHVAAAEQSGPLEDYLNQKQMFGERSAPVEALARALDGPVKDLRASLRSFAQDARTDVPGQGSMLQTEKPSATNAFNHAFGTSLSEPEFHDALRGAMEDEAPKAQSQQPGGYGSKNTLVTREDYEQTKKDFNHDLMDKMNAGAPITPEALAKLTKMGMFHLEAGAREFSDWSLKMIADSGEKIRPYLHDIFDSNLNALGDKNKAGRLTANMRSDAKEGSYGKFRDGLPVRFSEDAALQMYAATRAKMGLEVPDWVGKRQLDRAQVRHSITAGKGLKFEQHDAEHEGPGWKTFYAGTDGHTVGKMIMSPEGHGQWAVRLVQAAPDMTGLGFGKAAYDHAIQFAKKQGATELTSDPEGGTKNSVAGIWRGLGATETPGVGEEPGKIRFRLNLGKR